MKVLLEIPDSALVLTYQVVYDDPEAGMVITQKTCDTNKLQSMREEVKDGAD